MNPLCDYIPSAECLTRIGILSNLQNAHIYPLIHEEKYYVRANQNVLTTKVLKQNICHITGGITEISAIIKKCEDTQTTYPNVPKELTNLICAEDR